MSVRSALTLGSAALALIGLAVGLSAAAVPACLLLLVLCLPGQTLARRCLYAFVVLFAANAAVLTGLAVLGLRCSPVWVFASYIVLLTPPALKTGAQARLPLVDRQDAWALSLAVVTAAVLLRPFLHATPGEAMALLSQTTDGANHTQLLLATQRAGGYVAFRHLPGLRHGMENYPGAWSGNAWILGRLLLGRALNPIEAVRLLGLLGVACYCLLTMLLARVALALATSLRPTSKRRELLIITLMASTTTVGFGLFLLNLTSYTQIVAAIAIAASLLLTTEGASDASVAVVMTAAAIAVSQTWYLLVPVHALIALVVLLQLRPRRWVVMSCLLIVIPLAAFPVVQGPGAQHSQSSGPEILPVLIGVLGLLVVTGTAIVLVLRDRPRNDVIRLATAASLVASLLLVLVFAVTQPHDVPGASYYTAKVLLFLLLLGATAGAGVAGSAHDYNGRILTGTVVLGLLCSVWSTRHATLPPRASHTAGHLDARELNAAFARHSTRLDPRTDVWIADGCDRVWDLIASKWLYDLNVDWSEGRAEALQAYVDDRDKGLDAITARASDPAVDSIEVFVRRDCQPAKIALLSQVPKVMVIRVS
jgi:hypothetical protein